MFGKIKEGTIQIENSHMHYAAFGKGSRPLVIIPGLSDGLRTIKGTGLLLWFLYRSFAKEYRIWVFSRKNELEPGITTREMARDQAAAMDKLEIKGEELKKIICPTLIIGGGEDKIVGGAGVQQEMADNITDNRLVLYPDLGHDAYTAGDFNSRVLDFLQ